MQRGPEYEWIVKGGINPIVETIEHETLRAIGKLVKSGFFARVFFNGGMDVGNVQQVEIQVGGKMVVEVVGNARC